MLERLVWIWFLYRLGGLNWTGRLLVFSGMCLDYAVGCASGFLNLVLVHSLQVMVRFVLCFAWLDNLVCRLWWLWTRFRF